MFKRVLPQLRNDNCQIVIKADKVPSGEHAGRFNEPTVDEVAIIMVGDPVNNRDIRTTRRDRTVSVISDLDHSYDGHHINIKQCDSIPGMSNNQLFNSIFW